MESRTTERFRKCFESLPTHIKDEAKRVFKTWKLNPYQKNLKFKRIHNKENIYSVRITLRWRALGIKEENQMVWFWIGSHGDYDKMIESLK